uniref:Uncharacterized protein n=1 Tax=Medicago truncatula TaxID=3880 RepID=Q2HW34_MEDTR|nr:hypothetical protein MtrDRAFT_AC147963g16v2 [Medicago truncatula]
MSDELAPIDESVSKESVRGCDPSIPYNKSNFTYTFIIQLKIISQPQSVGLNVGNVVSLSKSKRSSGLTL